MIRREEVGGRAAGVKRRNRLKVGKALKVDPSGKGQKEDGVHILLPGRLKLSGSLQYINKYICH